MLFLNHPETPTSFFHVSGMGWKPYSIKKTHQLQMDTVVISLEAWTSPPQHHNEHI